MTEHTPPNQFVTLNSGVVIHYLDWGEEKELPAVIALHGSLTTGRMWDWTGARLKGKYRLIAPDLRGFGDSPAEPALCTVDYMAEDLEEFAGRLGLAQFHLLGHSLGSRVAGKFSIEYPEKVKSLVLVDTSDFAMGDRRKGDPAELAKRPDTFASLAEAVEYFRKNEGQNWPEEWLQHHVHTVLAKDQNGGFRHKVRTKVLIQVRSVLNPNFFPLAYKILAPTLILRGAESQILKLEEAQFLARVIEKSQLVEIPKTGHFIVQERFEVFFKLLEEFLKYVERERFIEK